MTRIAIAASRVSMARFALRISILHLYTFKKGTGKVIPAAKLSSPWGMIAEFDLLFCPPSTSYECLQMVPLQPQLLHNGKKFM